MLRVSQGSAVQVLLYNRSSAVLLQGQKEPFVFCPQSEQVLRGATSSFLLPVVTLFIAMASNLLAMASNLLAMASYLRATASNLVASCCYQ